MSTLDEPILATLEEPTITILEETILTTLKEPTKATLEEPIMATLDEPTMATLDELTMPSWMSPPWLHGWTHHGYPGGAHHDCPGGSRPEKSDLEWMEARKGLSTNLSDSALRFIITLGEKMQTQIKDITDWTYSHRSHSKTWGHQWPLLSLLRKFKPGHFSPRDSHLPILLVMHGDSAFTHTSYLSTLTTNNDDLASKGPFLRSYTTSENFNTHLDQRKRIRICVSVRTLIFFLPILSPPIFYVILIHINECKHFLHRPWARHSASTLHILCLNLI